MVPLCGLQIFQETHKIYISHLFKKKKKTT